MLTVNLDGQFFTEVLHPLDLIELADFAEVDVSRLSIPADELAAYEADQARKVIRDEILPTAGDVQSRQGTIADNVGLLLEGIGRFMALATTSSDPVLAGAAQSLADDLAPLITGIDGGTYTLTHHVKGTPTIVTDGGERATAVSTAIIANAGG